MNQFRFSRRPDIGDKVRVCLDRIDPAERKLQFSIVEPERKKKKRVKPRH